jgi:peroxiredoxin
MACLTAGESAPDFTLHTDRGEAWRLSEHLGRPLILMFHRHLQ